MKKFTIGHLEIRKLDLTDIISLSVFALVCIGRLYVNLTLYPDSFDFFYDFGVASVVFIVVMSSFLNRFTSAFFALGWLVLSLLYILEGRRAISYFPFCIFLFFYVIRYFFRKRYNREFIAPTLGRGGYIIGTYSKTQGLSGGKEDVTYMKFFQYMDFFILICCLVLFGHRMNGSPIW